MTIFCEIMIKEISHLPSFYDVIKKVPPHFQEVVPSSKSFFLHVLSNKKNNCPNTNFCHGPIRIFPY